MFLFEHLIGVNFHLSVGLDSREFENLGAISRSMPDLHRNITNIRQQTISSYDAHFINSDAIW